MEIEKGNSRYQYPQDTILGTKGMVMLVESGPTSLSKTDPPGVERTDRGFPRPNSG
jgi:hypothetical protein